MNAKDTYQKNYGGVRKSASLRWTVDNGDAREYEQQAMTSYRMATVKNYMTFRQFIDCLEAAYTGKAYATRNHWFFIVDGQELQFTKEECARFARYFSEGFHMNFAGYTHILKSGGLYINERLFEDDEVFPLKVKLYAYNRFVLGQVHCATKTGWVCHHNSTAADAKFFAIEDEKLIAIYAEEQSDIRAEMEMQRYG